MRISDWSSDVCSSDLVAHRGCKGGIPLLIGRQCVTTENRRTALVLLRIVFLWCGAVARVRVRVTLEDDVLEEIGRASCRERVCQYVKISVVAVSIDKKIKKHNKPTKQDNRIQIN